MTNSQKTLSVLALIAWGCTSSGSPPKTTTTPAQAQTPSTQTAQQPAASPASSAQSVANRAGPGPGAVSVPNADPFPSTYKTFPSRTTLIRNVTVMTAAGPSITNGAVLLRDGKIAAVGTNLAAPSDAVVVDGAGKYLTPGVIDTHSHLGVYPAPGSS